MAKMNITPEDRPKVKAECLRSLVTLKLDPARTQLISGFIDTYLTLTPEEESTFRLEINRVKPEQEEQIMKIVTSWMKEGIEIGRQEGRQEGLRLGEARMLLRILTSQLGKLPLKTERRIEALDERQIEQLGDRLSDIKTTETLTQWLGEIGAQQPN